MFRASDLVLLSKSDLLPVLGDFNPDTARQHLQQLANPAPAYELSARSGDGMESWLHWLLHEISLLEHEAGALRPGTGSAVTVSSSSP
jgi:hydrogenase nickel incorporation protein HypB